MERTGLFYVRFMHDIMLLNPARRWLPKTVKVVNQVLGSLWLDKHPEKTFIGGRERGLRLPWLSLQPEGPGCGRGDSEAVPFTCNPAL